MDSNIKEKLGWAIVIVVTIVVAVFFLQQGGEKMKDNSVIKEASLLAEVNAIGLSHYGVLAGVQNLRAVVNGDTEYLKEEKDNFGNKKLVPAEPTDIKIGDMVVVVYKVNTTEGFSFSDKGLDTKEIQILLKPSF